MAGFDYARLAGRAEALVMRFGDAATLIQRVATTGDAWNPTQGAETRTAITVVVIDKGSSGQRKDADPVSLTLGTRRIAYMAAGADVEPAVDDKIELNDDQEYRIARLERVKPGPTTVLYVMELAR